jgi:hypothetical protein
MIYDEFGNPTPPELIKLTDVEFKSAFVEIEDLETRKSIFNGYISYNNAIAETTDCDRWNQWIGGGYTTNKKNPSDIDVVNLMDPQSATIVLDEKYPFRTKKKNEVGPCSRKIFMVDGYVVPLLPTNDPRYQVITVGPLNYWKKWLGKDRDGNLRAVIEVAAQ